MGTEDQERLMDAIRAARPPKRPTAQEWVESERGQRVFARALAETDATAKTVMERRTASSRDRSRSRRTYWVAAAAAVVAVVGLSVGLVFADRIGGSDVVAQDSQTTAAGADVSASGGLVSKSSAVQNVMRLVIAERSALGDSYDLPEWDAAALLATAVDEGLISSAEVADGAAQPILEGQYAVLLWEAFGTFFPDVFGAGLPAVTLVGEANAEVVAAVEGLRRVGVLRYSDGAMNVGEPLLTERERLLLSRTEAALRGETAD